MSNTNQVCITCTQRDGCQYYDPNRTLCVPVKVIDYGQFEGPLKQSTVDWQHYRIQASIAAMQGMVISDAYCSEEPVGPSYQIKRRKWPPEKIAKEAVAYADFLIAELQKKVGQDDSNVHNN